MTNLIFLDEKKSKTSEIFYDYCVMKKNRKLIIVL